MSFQKNKIKQNRKTTDAIRNIWMLTVYETIPFTTVFKTNCDKIDVFFLCAYDILCVSLRLFSFFIEEASSERRFIFSVSSRQTHFFSNVIFMCALKAPLMFPKILALTSWITSWTWFMWDTAMWIICDRNVRELSWLLFCGSCSVDV